jgi:hypothetical protein
MHLLHHDLARARIAELRAEAVRAAPRPPAAVTRRVHPTGAGSRGERWPLAVLRWLAAAGTGHGAR